MWSLGLPVLAMMRRRKDLKSVEGLAEFPSPHSEVMRELVSVVKTSWGVAFCTSACHSQVLLWEEVLVLGLVSRS